MSVAAKVWGPGEQEPPDGVLTHLTSAPPNWFREDPEYAAELYALERGIGDRCMPDEYQVLVRDTDGALHAFAVRPRMELHVSVRRL